MSRWRAAGVLAAWLALEAFPARAADIELWTARAIATVLAETGTEFERATGHRLHVRTGLPADFESRLAAGEAFDVLVSSTATVERWMEQGRLVPQSRVDLARSGIGVAVKTGAPKPALDSVAAFRQALLDADSIAYLKIGSGLHLDRVIERLGIADALNAKTIRPDTDSVCELVAAGKVDLGMVVITQILTTPGVELAGPLPEEIQARIVFAGAVGKNSKAPEAAAQLLSFLKGPVAAPVFKAQAMEQDF